MLTPGAFVLLLFVAQHSPEALFMVRAFCITLPDELVGRVEELGMKDQLLGNPVAMNAAPPPHLPEALVPPPRSHSHPGSIGPAGSGMGGRVAGGARCTLHGCHHMLTAS